MNQTLAITRGYPASGKSTLALTWVQLDPSSRARVNRDALRDTLFGSYTGLTGDQEVAVTKAQHASVRALLRAGKSVVVDDTNLRLRVARSWADIAAQEGVVFEVWNVESPIEECFANDRGRAMAFDRSVGEDVIRDFARRYPMPWPEVKPTPRKAEDPPAPYVPDTSKTPAIIVDLDGTLAHNVTGREFWGEGLNRVYEDDVDENVNGVAWRFHVDGLARQLGRRVIFMSGRNESARAETERWLFEKADWYSDGYDLFMRESGDGRSDFIVKAELFDKHVRYNYNVLLALDDRDQVVNLWRGMGIPCWQVAPGAF